MNALKQLKARLNSHNTKASAQSKAEKRKQLRENQKEQAAS